MFSSECSRSYGGGLTTGNVIVERTESDEMDISLTLEYTESGSLSQRLDAIAGAGIPAVNLGTSQIRQLLKSEAQETILLRNQIDLRGLAVDWVHAPFRIPVIYDSSKEIYHVSMGALKHTIDLASELGAATIIVHAMNQDFPPEIATAPYIDQLIESYEVLVSFARERGVEVAVENIDEPYSFPIIEALFRDLGGLRFCFDTGHAQKYRVWDKYIPAFIGKISALHIHDNHGEEDEHLIPGEGTIDFADFLNRLVSAGYSGYLGVECVQRVSGYPGNQDSLAPLIRRRIDEIFTSMEDTQAEKE